MATQPVLTTATGVTWDGLVAGPYTGRGATLEMRASSTDAEYTIGRLLTRDVDGLYHPITGTATVVALGATTEVIKNSLAVTDLVIPFTLAHPPIPGTVHLATTADGSATVVKELGTDNGLGSGSGADGSFTVNYQTGMGVAYLTTAPTSTHDLKAGYSYMAVDTPDAGETATGMPVAVLMENVTGASVIAGNVVCTVAIAGTFVRSKLLGYHAGYETFLNSMGIYSVVAAS